MKYPAMLRSLASPAAHRRPIRFLHRILRLQDLFRQRSTLARLDAHLLRDIGLNWPDA